MNENKSAATWQRTLSLGLMFTFLSGNTTAQSVGVVWMVDGDVHLQDTRSKNEKKSLLLGQEVPVGATVVTGAKAHAVLKMADGSLIATRPGSTVTMTELPEMGDDTGRFWLHLIQGGLRIITGRVGKLHPAGYRITTQTATIGIRGTDHEPYSLGDNSKEAPPGTYDKVNKGATFLEAAGKRLDIKPGEIGYARNASSIKPTPKALATLLHPYILRLVPNFYQKGPFEAMMDAYIADDVTERTPISKCAYELEARRWLGSLDQAISNKSSPQVMTHFSSNALVSIMDKAASHGSVESPVMVLDPSSFAQSAMEALSGLENHHQTRLTINVQSLHQSEKSGCSSFEIRSKVFESGISLQKPYSAFTEEQFYLSLVNDRWVAIKANLYPLQIQ